MRGLRRGRMWKRKMVIWWMWAKARLLRGLEEESLEVQIVVLILHVWLDYELPTVLDWVKCCKD